MQETELRKIPAPLARNVTKKNLSLFLRDTFSKAEKKRAIRRGYTQTDGQTDGQTGRQTFLKKRNRRRRPIKNPKQKTEIH